MAVVNKIQGDRKHFGEIASMIFSRIMYEGHISRRIIVVFDVDELFSSQEDADTRILFHAKHISQHNFNSIIVASADTDVRLLCMAYT